MKRIAFAFALLPSIALAQPAAPTPTEQALGAKLMREINEGLQCTAAAAALQAEVAALKAKIKESEDQKK